MALAEKHPILGGKVHVYKGPRSAVWQCSTYIEGKNRRVSTSEKSLAKAKEFAEDWYLDLRGKKARGELVAETKPTDLHRPSDHKQSFNRILAETDPKIDRKGNRSLYSLRRSYWTCRAFLPPQVRAQPLAV